MAHLFKLMLLSSALPTSSLLHNTFVTSWHHQKCKAQQPKTDMQDAYKSMTLTRYRKCHCMPSQVKMDDNICASLPAEHSCRY